MRHQLGEDGRPGERGRRGLIAEGGCPLAGEAPRCLQSVGGARQEGSGRGRAAAIRWTAAARFSRRDPGVGGRNRMAEQRTRGRAATVSQGVAGNTRRHASLPCLDRKNSWLAPSVVSRESLIARGSFLCAFEDSKVVPNRPAHLRRTGAECTQYTKCPGRSPEDRDASRSGKNLAKSFHPHAAGVRSQALLLMVAAGGASGWIKNTQRSRAGNSRMGVDQRAAPGKRQSATRVV